jgi:hypothetical protein
MPRSSGGSPWRRVSIAVLIAILASAAFWWRSRDGEESDQDLPAAASAEPALPPLSPTSRADQTPPAGGESWFTLVAEIEKARAVQDQEAVAALLEPLRGCEDPALVEYLFARLCETESPDLWVGLLAFASARRLGPNGEILEVHEPLVSRVLAVISLPREPSCRERVVQFLELLLAGQKAPCDALSRYVELALGTARPADVTAVMREVAGHVGCGALLDQLGLQAGAGVDLASLDDLLAQIRAASKDERVALVRDFIRRLPAWEAARVVERLEAEPRQFPSALDPYQVALEELARRPGGLDYLESRLWAEGGESLGLLVHAVAEVESDRSYDILRALVMEKKQLGAELPAALVGLCNMTNRRDSDRICLAALQGADGDSLDANAARLMAGAAVVLAEKERQRGLLSDGAIAPVRWVLASARSEELVRAVLEECVRFDALREAIVPQITSELLWRADHVSDPDLAARLRELARR